MVRGRIDGVKRALFLLKDRDACTHLLAVSRAVWIRSLWARVNFSASEIGVSNG